MHYHVVSFQEYCCQVTKDRCPGFFLYYTKHAFLIFTLLKLSYCLTLMFDSNEFFILFTCKYIPYLTLLNLSCCFLHYPERENVSCITQCLSLESPNLCGFPGLCAQYVRLGTSSPSQTFGISDLGFLFLLFLSWLKQIQYI